MVCNQKIQMTSLSCINLMWRSSLQILFWVSQWLEVRMASAGDRPGQQDGREASTKYQASRSRTGPEFNYVQKWCEAAQEMEGWRRCKRGQHEVVQGDRRLSSAELPNVTYVGMSHNHHWPLQSGSASFLELPNPFPLLGPAPPDPGSSGWWLSMGK